MAAEAASKEDPRVQAALSELQEMIRRRYPETIFEVTAGEDNPEAIHLVTTVDLEDTDEVLDLVVDRVLELQIDEGLPVYVIPVRPIERVLEDMRARNTRGSCFWQGTALDP
jgi:hypothetical protein